MDHHQNGATKALERVNLMLTRADSAWLDGLANEIRSANGAKVSRSEIVRAALAAVQELHKAGNLFNVPLSSCRSASELAQMGSSPRDARLTTQLHTAGDETDQTGNGSRDSPNGHVR